MRLILTICWCLALEAVFARQQIGIIDLYGNRGVQATAMIAAYHPDKAFVVKELLYAIADNDEEVRNNATRALWVLADYFNEHPEKRIDIPASPFIDMLRSAVWTDRNKGALVLLALTQGRNGVLLPDLKALALPSLAEMARWRQSGHAFQSYMILGRMAGLPDEACFQAFNSDQRLSFLDAMLLKIEKP